MTRVDIHHLPEVGSTNDEALARARALDTPAPLALRADVQTAGRGRLGRSWSSPTGGLWMSVAWPCAHGPERYEPAPVLVGLALREALLDALDPARRAHAADALAIKWPNDVLAHGRKLAGVLCERPGGAEASWLVIGTGVNLETPSVERATGGIEPVGAREALDLVSSADELAPLVANRVVSSVRALEDDAPRACADAREALASCLAYAGERVTITQLGAPGRNEKGVVHGVDERLRLLLETDDGSIRPVAAGELLRLRSPGA